MEVFSKNGNGITYNQILKYIFKGVSAKDEKKIEAFLDDNQYYAELVEGLMDYCLDNNLNCEQLEIAVGEVKMEVLAEVEDLATAPSKIASFLNKISEYVDYSIEQLKEFFEPVPHYDSLIAGTSRADSFVLSVPENGKDVRGILNFELSKPIDCKVTVKIEDSREEVMCERTFPPFTKHFQVSLNESQMHPGVYYWKLRINEDMKIGTFYVRKELNPQFYFN